MPEVTKKPRKYVLITSDWSGLGFVIHKVQRHGGKHQGSVIVAYKPEGSVLEKLQNSPDQVKLYQKEGKGLVETIPLVELMKKRAQFKDWYWVWDGNHNAKENDILRKEGFKVINGHAEARKMEHDRDYTIKVMQSLGFATPDHREFKSVAEGIAFLKANPDKAYVYKPNDADSSLTVVPDNEIHREANIEIQELIQAIGINDFVLQEKVRGVEVNVECFCIKGEPVFAHANLECKRRSNRDLGKPLGCAMDVCWEVPLTSKIVAMTVGKMRPLIKKLNYTGFADVNCIIGDDGAYFLETCWRTGYNAHPNLFFNLSKQEYLSSMADMIDGSFMPDFRKGFGASITMVTDCPYGGIPVSIPEIIKDKVFLFDGMKQKDGIAQTGYSNDKEIAIVFGHGYTIASAFEDATRNAFQVKFVGRDFRTDGDRVDYPLSMIRRYEALEAMGLT